MASQEEVRAKREAGGNQLAEQVMKVGRSDREINHRCVDEEAGYTQSEEVRQLDRGSIDAPEAEYVSDG